MPWAQIAGVVIAAIAAIASWRSASSSSRAAKRSDRTAERAAEALARSLAPSVVNQLREASNASRDPDPVDVAIELQNYGWNRGKVLSAELRRSDGLIMETSAALPKELGVSTPGTYEFTWALTQPVGKLARSVTAPTVDTDSTVVITITVEYSDASGSFRWMQLARFHERVLIAADRKPTYVRDHAGRQQVPDRCDQPLLSAMYVDKKLAGVTAVQTLSRLNRTHRAASGEQKRKTFVLDFVNKPEDIRTAFEPYFTDATLETETDPYVVFHLTTKLDQAGIFTPEQVREAAELWVTRKGNSALSAAISPARNEFARRYAAAKEADDTLTRNTLDLFRKDVSTFVRLYDFMSQIVDYGDPYLEMLSIFLRLLEKVIAESSWTADVDLSDVVLLGVKHTKTTAVDISLTGDGQLKGISAAGTGARKEPKYDALQVVIDRMNDFFGAESFTESQVREFVQGLVQRLLAYPDLINQTKVNSKKQFMESQDFQAAVTEAVADNQQAHNTMVDYFFCDGPGINAVIVALADAFYEAAIDQQTE